jgi:hypothetical protein
MLHRGLLLHTIRSTTSCVVLPFPVPRQCSVVVVSSVVSCPTSRTQSCHTWFLLSALSTSALSMSALSTVLHGPPISRDRHPATSDKDRSPSCSYVTSSSTCMHCATPTVHRSRVTPPPPRSGASISRSPLSALIARPTSPPSIGHSDAKRRRNVARPADARRNPGLPLVHTLARTRGRRVLQGGQLSGCRLDAAASGRPGGLAAWRVDAGSRSSRRGERVLAGAGHGFHNIHAEEMESVRGGGRERLNVVRWKCQARLLLTVSGRGWAASNARSFVAPPATSISVCADTVLYILYHIRHPT